MLQACIHPLRYLLTHTHTHSHADTHTLQAQAGWLQHDFGHHTVFSDNRFNRAVHHIIIGLMKGVSSFWWNYRHFQHHAKPNVVSWGLIKLPPSSAYVWVCVCSIWRILISLFHTLCFWVKLFLKRWIVFFEFFFQTNVCVCLVGKEEMGELALPLTTALLLSRWATIQYIHTHPNVHVHSIIYCTNSQFTLTQM